MSETQNGQPALTLEQMLAKATNPGSIAPSYGMVELPLKRDLEGKPVCVVVRAIDLDVILMARGGLPAIINETEKPEEIPGALLAQRIVAWKPGASQIAEAGVMAPPMSFGPDPEDGKLWWPSLQLRDQVQIVGEINRVSGFGREENKPIAAFPENEEGRAGSEPAGEAVADGEGAAIDAAPGA